MRRPVLLVVLALAALTAVAPALAAPPPADLRADVNRDGIASLADPADDLGEDSWDAAHGAIVLPNVDDDGRRCGVLGRGLSDVALARCDDAADTVVNGSLDALDLAPLRTAPWPDAPAGATGTVAIAQSSRGRLFVLRDGALTKLEGGALTLAELHEGAQLAIEARDVARDLRVWNGHLTVTLTLRDGSMVSADTVDLRVAPVLFQHDLMPVSRLLTSPPVPSDAGEFAYSPATYEPGDQSTRRALAIAAAEARRGQASLFAGLRRGLVEAGGSASLQALHPAKTDIWAQDVFEPGYASFPVPGGTQAMRILVRSANANRTGAHEGRPLRDAGRPVFTQLRGRGVGAVQQYSPAWQRSAQSQDTYSSTGNFGATPPFVLGARSFPAGRVVYGSAPGHAPDPSFTRLLAAQSAQPPIVLDTSWLVVGHIDEVVSFLPAPTPRGWVVAVADPRAAIALLQSERAAGRGDDLAFPGLDDPVFSDAHGKLRLRLRPLQRSITSLLARPSLLRANELAASSIDRAIAVLKTAAGLTDDEIVHVPVLFGRAPRGLHSLGLLALTPDAVNGISLGGGVYLAPAQHGPIIAGVDIFEQAVRDRLAPLGLRVRFVEDWSYAHRGVGELHCVTNTLRALDGALPWWTATQ